MLLGFTMLSLFLCLGFIYRSFAPSPLNAMANRWPFVLHRRSAVLVSSELKQSLVSRQELLEQLERQRVELLALSYRPSGTSR